MRVEVWGLGHAGLVCATCLAQQGHRVVGIDVDRERIERLNAGEVYLREPELAGRVAANVANGRLRATSTEKLDEGTPDAAILCLPTPEVGDAPLDTRAILATVPRLAERLRASTSFASIVVRSTVPVHFTRDVLRPRLEAASGRRAGVDFGVAMIPEFLREGRALDDFDRPALVIVGADDAASRAAVRPLFASPMSTLHDVPTGVAELLKLANNGFHALKVSFANEVARVAHSCGVDGHEVMRLLAEDKRLNASAAYLAPGFAYGGPCLDKDLAALRALATTPEAPLLDAIAASNSAHLAACRRAIEARPWRRIGFHGVTNNAGSDDLRRSPALALIASLALDRGALWIYDPDLHLDQVTVLEATYGARVAADLSELERETDLVVNFRREPLPAMRVPELHFARFWRGEEAR